ncbi:membrane associated rhomboid family serine protease [Natranaerovirga pectinivora]|uniref:Membrane associated rhomboid family serine protease n=1 Tax=Natranaerovirga pectinivora TaxID=682400 RepID=A0A4R3MKF8_9FIRM|nr:rhomboid family intramembrane serine protease [Natranaerovirga pectinivora]TCT12932.1 membrane associated rhomboid family serine protease [Natranaerovirga pectinivora]
MQIFMKKFNGILLGDGFKEIPTDLETVWMYGKIKNNDLYLLNIIGLKDNLKISLEQYEVYKDITKRQFSKYGYNRIYLLNIYLTSEKSDLNEKLNDFIPNYQDELIDFHWVVNLTEGDIYVSNNQPNNFLNVYSIIESILNNEEYKNLEQIHYKSKFIPITAFLLAINTLIWVIMELVGSSTDSRTLIEFGALFSPAIIYHREYYRLFTAMFLHIGFSHLFYNMFALYLFGSRLEKVLGQYRYTILYIAAGLGGSLLSFGTVLFSEGSIRLAAGASGAIYGLQGAALYITMKTKSSLNGVSEGLLWIMTFGGLIFGFTSTNVDNMAHIGGLVTGYILMIVLNKSKNQELMKNNEIVE